MSRPISIAWQSALPSSRTLAEARPYFHYFPFKDDIPARFLAG